MTPGGAGRSLDAGSRAIGPSLPTGSFPEDARFNSTTFSTTAATAAAKTAIIDSRLMWSTVARP